MADYYPADEGRARDAGGPALYAGGHDREEDSAAGPPRTPHAAVFLPAEQLPSAERQRRYIVDNSGILDLATKKLIYSFAMMQQVGEGCIMVDSVTGFVSLNLDAIKDAGVVLHIYNIVHNRRKALEIPATDLR